MATLAAESNIFGLLRANIAPMPKIEKQSHHITKPSKATAKSFRTETNAPCVQTCIFEDGIALDGSWAHIARRTAEVGEMEDDILWTIALRSDQTLSARNGIK